MKKTLKEMIGGLVLLALYTAAFIGMVALLRTE